MAVPSWPAGVPSKPVLSGLSVGQTYRPPLVSETDGGPAIMRRRPGPRATEIPFQSVLLSRAQWSTLETFLRETLIDGTLVFTMPVFRPDGCMVTRHVQIKDGLWQTDMSAVSRFRVSLTLIVYNW
jgi:hypothetical protein